MKNDTQQYLMKITKKKCGEVVFQQGSRDKVDITITKYPSDRTAKVKISRGKSLSHGFIIIFDLKAKAHHIYDITCGNAEGDYPYYDYKSYNPITKYIYNIRNSQVAENYAKIFPYDCGYNMDVNVKTLGDLMTIGGTGDTASFMGVLNKGKQTKYILCDDNKIYPAYPDKPIQIPTSARIEWLTIRDHATPKNMAYKDLSLSEKQTYIPKEIATGNPVQTHYATVYSEWVPSTDYLYNGTLTYVPTNDKEYHMIDENKNKYRYGIQQFRDMIPYIYNGVVSGSFKLVGTGNRQIRYILVPFKPEGQDKSAGLVMCDSSDSDSESEP